MSRLRRTVCESVGERWRDRAGSLRALGIRSHRCLHTCWRGWSTRSIFDHRETVMGLCRLPRTVCESVGERWRDGSGSLLILGYPVTKMLAHMLARVVDAADRSTTEKRRRGSSRWMSGRACVCLYGYARKSIGSKRQEKCGMERAVATVGCRVKAIAKGVAACVSCEHACTRLLHA